MLFSISTISGSITYYSNI